MGEVPTPFFQVALGRSGTTMAMRLFSSHPDVVAHAAYPLELRALASAWHPHDERLIAGLRHYRDIAPFTEDDRAAIDGGEAPDLASVRALYGRIAEGQGKSHARYATEKYPPRLDLAEGLNRQPEAKILILVRDPRDVIVSARAFDEKRGYRGFLEQAGDTDADLVRRYADQYARLHQILSATPDAVVVRYEDMVADPAAVATRVFRWLGVAADEHTVAEAVRRGLAKKPGRHLTAASVPKTVGRWRDGLEPATAALAASLMTAELAAFGYRV